MYINHTQYVCTNVHPAKITDLAVVNNIIMMWALGINLHQQSTGFQASRMRTVYNKQYLKQFSFYQLSLIDSNIELSNKTNNDKSTYSKKLALPITLCFKNYYHGPYFDLGQFYFCSLEKSPSHGRNQYFVGPLKHKGHHGTMEKGLGN